MTVINKVRDRKK